MEPFWRNHGKGSSYSSVVSYKGVSLKHKKVNKALSVFRKLSSKLFDELKAENPRDSGAKFKALCNAAKIMSDKHACENTKKRVGVVEGIEIGDKFQYRAELVIIGLHLQHSSGIDYMGKGESSLATSIVVTKRYANTINPNGSLVYIGQGGNSAAGRNVLSHDQKLEGGNLAMKNSMDARSPVRVILKVFGSSDYESENESDNSSMFSYIYDGLYWVTDFTQGRGNNGKLVFKFTLDRMLNQPQSCVAHGDLGLKGSSASSSSTHKRSKGSSSAAQKEKTRRNDVSEGKENFAIPLMATSDCAEFPPPFEYIVDLVYSGRLSLMQQPNPKDSRAPFQLAIYKTERKGWGVRTRSYIPSGSFVCEFIGEVHHYGSKAGLRLGVDNYILDMGMYVSKF
ncbi:histone-lysine N-methyltransferase, H3 lysine-9 specific SUVH5-like [Lotus japonicus]|uniref:histone-lysine N-methyltransferase, H3 lysine-9 specific SUVH5-like n=1 Tax=Lotus japonicus TaxID=34305 RepID=UPI00258D2E91|nr:histone-lysine N-methyltransferase, H3 lysine-9 specific SUVH5-like [Lotus japonicus]